MLCLATWVWKSQSAFLMHTRLPKREPVGTSVLQITLSSGFGTTTAGATVFGDDGLALAVTGGGVGSANAAPLTTATRTAPKIGGMDLVTERTSHSRLQLPPYA